MWKSTVLSLPPQLVFLVQLNNILPYTSKVALGGMNTRNPC
jgi:hypothetical protein